MNCFVSGNGNGSSYLQSLGGGTTYRIYEKMFDFNNPSLVWVVLDESCDSIGDAFFGVDMASPITITDRPASYHVGACGLAFADGHAEIHKWQDPWARLPLEDGTYMYNTMVGPHDMPWLKQRTTESK
jgi:prepilin-type processing-associated H-X9-DG protein